MTSLSLSKAWDETKAIVARDGQLFASVALGLVVLPQTIIGVFAPRSNAITPAIWVFLAISVVFGFVAQVSLNRLAIGPSTSVGSAIRRGFVRMPVLVGSFAILVIALVILLIVIGMILGAVGLMAPPSAGQPPPLRIVAILVLLTAAAYAVFQLTVPAAAVEDGGSIRLIVRSWELARGQYLQLLAFVALVLTGLLTVFLAGQFVFGSLIALVLGPPETGSLSALVISFVAAVIQSVFTVIFGVMLARIYVQLSGRGSGPGVPKSGT